MMVSRLVLPGAVLLATVAACSSREPVAPVSAPTPAPSAPTPVVTAVAPVASAPASAPPAARSLCEAVLARNRQLLADQQVALPNPDPDDEETLTAACYPTPGGAWAVRLLSWQKDTQGDPSIPSALGRIEVVHLTAAGESTWPPARGKEAAGILYSTGLTYGLSRLHRPVLADIDQDGEPEMFLVLEQIIHEDADDWTSALLTAQGGSVRPVAGVPEMLTKMVDVDHDGIMDLLYTPFAQQRTNVESGFSYNWSGPELLAHGRPRGVFALDDDAALAHARPSCPARPPRPARVTPAKRDAPAPPELCARLWGQSETQARALLKAQCPAAPGKPGGNECIDFADRESALKLTPPLRLR